MKKFNCNCCNYSTDDFSNWNKHIKSRKHNSNSNKHMKTTYIIAPNCSKLLSFAQIMSNQNINKPPNQILKTTTESNESTKSNYEQSKSTYHILKCLGCGRTFSKKFNLDRHEKACMGIKHNLLENQFEKYKKEKDVEYQLKIMEEKLKLMEEKNKSLEKEKNTMKEHIDTLKNENDFQKQLINCAGGLVQKSVNTMSYLLLNHNNAPQLQSLSDYSIISKDTETLIKDLIHYHKTGKFDKYIGDFIVKQYKKEDPNLQALWSSDVERLNYFIRELINNNKNEKQENTANLKDKNHINWIVDKKGIKVKKCIIDPLLEYINKIGIKYLNEKNKEITDLDIAETHELLNDMQQISSISNGIKNKSIANSINKYIAPHFFLNKEN